jgi:predicted AlkP superfamily pyrophosphatase or phosphodiesterase
MRRTVAKRVLVVVIAAVVVTIGALVALRPATGVPENAPTLDEMADDIGSQVMLNLWRGHVPGRSAEVMLVPRPHRFLIGEWDLTTLGTADLDTSTSHPNPWNYLGRVPIIAYGPGYAAPGEVVDRPVDIGSIAPTYARLLGMEGLDFDAESLPEIPAEEAPRPPKVIFTVVIDGGGWNALQQHSDAWPEMRRLMRRGTTFVNANIGSAPSITGAIHATFGTGTYPMTHLVPGNQMRGSDGRNTDTWLQNADPRYLDVPTVSELWDKQNDNRPFVGTVSYEGWHLGMIGHGAQLEGADRDVAVLWEAEDSTWWVNEDYYDLPDYLQPTDLDTLSSYEEDLDAHDGLADDTWYGHTLDLLREPLARPTTPAFARFTGDAVIEVMRRERVGRDDLTDLFWVEMKTPDYAGHAYNVISPEEEDVLRETDRQIGRYVRELDRTVGRGNYLFVISADHGQQPLPETVGGWRINNRELGRDIEARFGNIVEKETPVDIYFDMQAVEDSGVDLADVSRYIGTYTIAENIPEGAVGTNRVPAGRLDERLFAGAFTTDYFKSLSMRKIESFGDSAYEEGDLTIPFDEDNGQ